MDRDARFEGWMKAHLPLLARVSRGFADPADQHDLLQELMLAVWKAAPAFRGDSAEATFIWRVAHNRALSWVRREHGRRRRDAQARQEFARWAEPADDGGEDATLLQRLYAAIRRLAPLDRSLVLLSLEGVAYREMAALHGLSESNVGARLNRARARITALVAEDDHGL